MMSSREVRRSNDISTLYGLGCQLRYKNIVIKAQLVNFHFLGACIRIENIESLPFSIKGHESEIKIDLLLGNSFIKKDIPYLIVWEKIESNKEFGLKFISSASSLSIRNNRINSHTFLKPIYIAKDPIDPNRKVYFTVENLSKNGLLLSSALTNRHLFPGMLLKSGFISIPGEERIAIEATIANTRPSNSWDYFYLGCSIPNPSDQYLEAVRRYLLFLGGASYSKGNKIATDYGKEKKLKTGLSFKTVNSESEYQEVLQLRYKANLHKKKIHSNFDLNKLGDGLSSEGIVIAGYLSGKMVCSVDLRSCKMGHESWILLNSGFDQIDLLKGSEFIEINKLVIHPQVQNSDILIALYERIFAFCAVNGLPHIIMAATDKLVSLYEKLGIKKTGQVFSHPTLENENLNIMVADPDTYAFGKNMTLLAKQYLYHSLDTYFKDRNLNLGIKVGILSKSINAIFLWSYFLFIKVKTNFIKILKKLESHTIEKSKDDLGNHIDSPKFSEQHYNSTIVLPYILEADSQIGRNKVDDILTKLGVDRQFLLNQSNWLSVSFLDNFLIEYEQHGNIAELSWKSGERAMTKEVMGVTYHIVKHMPSPITLLKAFKRVAEKFNRTRNYKFEVLKNNRAKLLIGLKNGHHLPKHKEGCLNWEAGLYSFICMVTNKKATVEKSKCIFDGDGYCEYHISWSERTKGVLAVSAVVSVLALVGFGAFLNTHYLSPLENALLTSSTILLASMIYLTGYLRKKILENYNITKDFEIFQEEAFEKYKIFQKQKKDLIAQKKELKLLSETTKMILNRPSCESVLNTALKSISENFKFKRAFVMLKDPESSTLVTKAVYGADSHLSDLWNFKVDVSKKKDNQLLLSSVFSHGNSVYIEDIDKHYFQLNEKSKNLIDKLKCRSFIMVSIPINNTNNRGVLIADASLNEEDIKPNDIWILEKIAAITGFVINKLEPSVPLTMPLESIHSSNKTASPVSKSSTLSSIKGKLPSSTIKLSIYLTVDTKNKASFSVEFTNIIDIFEKFVTASNGTISSKSTSKLDILWNKDNKEAIHIISYLSVLEELYSQLNNLPYIITSRSFISTKSKSENIPANSDEKTVLDSIFSAKTHEVYFMGEALELLKKTEYLNFRIESNSDREIGIISNNSTNQPPSTKSQTIGYVL